MSLSSKRLSISSMRSSSPLPFAVVPNGDAEEWMKSWQQVFAKDLIDSPVVAVDADSTVEDACELLLSRDIPCLAVYHKTEETIHNTPFHGLFDYSDVNSFLTLAATRHRWSPEDLRERPRIEEIINAAIADRVSVYLVSNLSEKNPLEVLPHDATILSLLSVFSRGTHRALIQAPPPSTDFLGIVSDQSLLSWFTDYSQTIPSLLSYLSNSLNSLNLPSLYLYSSVVATKASDSVLDAMKLMSDQGVSSVAIVEEENGALLSAVSVTDIGKIVVPSQSNQILSTPLHLFIKRIKEPDGSTDGADKYPVYSVLPNSTLLYTMQKLIATNSHRLFVTDESPVSSSPTLAATPSPNLSGIVSIVDILSLFARTANLPGVDPTRMQRHRRASSTSSSQSPRSPETEFVRSRSSSRTSSRTGYLRNSVSSFEGFQWAERVPKP